MKYVEWEEIALFVSIAAVLISVIAAFTYNAIDERRTMVRAGMCEVYKETPHSWVWEKCK